MKARCIVGLLAMLLLAGCGLPFGVGRTMQDEITENVHQLKMHQDVLTDPVIKITHSLPGVAVALATYEANIDGEHVLVVHTTSLERQGWGWFASGSSSRWFPVDEPLPLFFAGGGNNGMSGDPTAHVEASGLVNDPAVREVVVTLSDSTRNVVPVEDGAFLFAKMGSIMPTKVEALDKQGNVLHQETFGN